MSQYISLYCQTAICKCQSHAWLHKCIDCTLQKGNIQAHCLMDTQLSMDLINKWVEKDPVPFSCLASQ